MNIGSIIDQTLDLAVTLEDRALGSRLQELAAALHNLYFDPSVTRPILEELAAHGQLTSMRRSEALQRFRQSSGDVARTLREIEEFLGAHGRRIFSPSELAQLQSYGRTKTRLRFDIAETIDDLIKLPMKHAPGQEPYDEIKRQARELLSRIDETNEHLDQAFRILRNEIRVAATSERRGRFPRSWLLVGVLFFLLLAAALTWSAMEDAVREAVVDRAIAAWNAGIDFVNSALGR